MSAFWVAGALPERPKLVEEARQDAMVMAEEPRAQVGCCYGVCRCAESIRVLDGMNSPSEGLESSGFDSDTSTDTETGAPLGGAHLRTVAHMAWCWFCGEMWVIPEDEINQVAMPGITPARLCHPCNWRREHCPIAYRCRTCTTMPVCARCMEDGRCPDCRPTAPPF